MTDCGLILDKLKTIILRDKSRKSYEAISAGFTRMHTACARGEARRARREHRDSGEIFKAESARLAVVVLFQLSLPFAVLNKYGRLKL